jgi:hypothetical protein
MHPLPSNASCRGKVLPRFASARKSPARTRRRLRKVEDALHVRDAVQSDASGKDGVMTGKADFTDEEWDLLREGPAAAGMTVVVADKGGTFRETFAMAKAYGEARNHHGESELLDELVAAGPKRGSRYHSPEELHEQGLQRLRQAADLLAKKATPNELQDYSAFVVTLAKKVADAHREHGQQVSEREQGAIRDIEASLSGPSA